MKLQRAFVVVTGLGTLPAPNGVRLMTGRANNSDSVGLGLSPKKRGVWAYALHWRDRAEHPSGQG